LEIILDLPFGFAINNIISRSHFHPVGTSSTTIGVAKIVNAANLPLKGIKKLNFSRAKLTSNSHCTPSNTAPLQTTNLEKGQTAKSTTLSVPSLP